MRATRRRSFAPALIVVAVVGGSALLSSSPPTRLARLESWLAALDLHQPGADDRAVSDVGSWPVDQIRTLWVDANVLVSAIRGADPDGIRFNPGERRPVRSSYTRSELKRMRELARNMRRPGATSRILKRGALLHTDIAMMNPPRPEPLPVRVPAGPWRIMMNTADGRSMDVGQAAVHWEVARLLLDLVSAATVEVTGERPDPARDPTVRDWYRATMAFALRQEQLEAGHFARGAQLFPDDAEILFFAGCVHETFAAPHIQSAIRSATLPFGVSFDIESDRAELRQAESLFRRAVAGNPGFAEAHVRLGRVLGRLGHHADAVAELRQALTLTDDPLLLYYADLFLAADEEALGHVDAARDAYAHAASRFPAAQSPRLGLSQLARRAGDRAGALKAMRHVFDPSDDAERSDDPWWIYYMTNGRNADALLAELRQPFLTNDRP